MAKVKLSVRSKVVYILHMAQGSWLSVSDIKNKYTEHYNASISLNTIVAAIDENNHINDNIRESTERRHQARQPVKVFQIPFKINQQDEKEYSSSTNS